MSIATTGPSLFAAAAVAAGAAAAAAVAVLPVAYRPPVDAPVADRFRPPATPYGRGNRGLQYATHAGQAVRAAGAGVVAFSGRVGTTLHVTVLHGDGLRTTYSYLEAVAVRVGDRVSSGQLLGRAGPQFHLGALVGDAYVDPEHLFRPGSGARRARLVADDGRHR